MEYAFTLNVLPVVGGVVIVLVLVLSELDKGTSGFGMGGSLPRGGYRYYIGEHTVLYLRQSGSCCRVYVLEGKAPPEIPLRHTHAGEFFRVRADTPAEAEIEIERLYLQAPELEK